MSLMRAFAHGPGQDRMRRGSLIVYSFGAYADQDDAGVLHQGSDPGSG